MKGLDLAERYWLDEGKPAFQRDCPEVLEWAAIGLVGEGSECFGFDDEISRDHDWGPRFCVWLPEEAPSHLYKAARAAYQSLPDRHLGYARVQPQPEAMDRQGVRSVEGFYRTYLGLPRAPETLQEWRLQSEAGLATAVNGSVFWDRNGTFTQVRKELLAYYPEDLRRKKIARRCALAAQSGQYNFPRCVQRGKTVAAFQALAEFIKEAQALVFLLNRRYQPYYKWTHTALEVLPVLGTELAPLFQKLTGGAGDTDAACYIEHICEMLISELKRQGLSDHPGTFLIDHGKCVQETIQDRDLRGLHLMAE